MNQWRYYAGAGLFAAVISLISGILGGNPFGVILLRMLFSALLLAGVGLGIGVMLRKFLPELMQDAAGARREAPEPAVDIVLPEENPHQGTAAAFDDAPESALESALDSAEGDEAADVEPLEELVEVEDSPAGARAAAPEPLPPAAEEEAEEAIPLGEEEISAEDGAEIDSLPNLDQFDSTNYVGPDISGLKNGGENFTQAQVDGIMSREDPAQLAKAVRTFLKKDQEG